MKSRDEKNEQRDNYNPSNHDSKNKKFQISLFPDTIKQINTVVVLSFPQKIAYKSNGDEKGNL